MTVEGDMLYPEFTIEGLEAAMDEAAGRAVTVRPDGTFTVKATELDLLVFDLRAALGMNSEQTTPEVIRRAVDVLRATVADHDELEAYREAERSLGLEGEERAARVAESTLTLRTLRSENERLRKLVVDLGGEP